MSFCILRTSRSHESLGIGRFWTQSEEYELSKWHLPTKDIIYASLDMPAASNLEYFNLIAKPPVILALGEKALDFLCPQTHGELTKWAGSILVSPKLTYPHYVIGTYGPYDLWGTWDQRDIVVSIDVARAVEEYNYFKKYDKLQELPSYQILTAPQYDTLMDYLEECFNSQYISSDLETIRPKKNTVIFENHPGLIYCHGIAKSSTSAVSFVINDYLTGASVDQNNNNSNNRAVKLVKKLNQLYTTVPQIGQNYFNFDIKLLEANGYTVCREKCRDTKINHQLLWPSLRHSLQFMTRQYTRQPYYKDEGRQFNFSRMRMYRDRFLAYNAMDCCVTYEVFERQLEELAERKFL